MYYNINANYLLLKKCLQLFSGNNYCSLKLSSNNYLSMYLFFHVFIYLLSVKMDRAVVSKMLYYHIIMYTWVPMDSQNKTDMDLLDSVQRRATKNDWVQHLSCVEDLPSNPNRSDSMKSASWFDEVENTTALDHLPSSSDVWLKELPDGDNPSCTVMTALCWH